MNKKVYKLPILMVFVITSMWVSSAHASLIGTTVTQCANTVYGGTVTTDIANCNLSTAQPTPTSAIIADPGVEFSLLNSGTRLFDFTDDTFTVTYNNVGSPSNDLYIFEFENIIANLTLLTPDPLGITTALNGNLLGILINDPSAEGRVTFGISAVPVPAAAWLFGSALLGFFGFSRRKANA